MYISYKTNFNLHLRNKDYASSSIRMRVTLHGKTPLDFALGISVPAAQWNAEKQRVEATCEDCMFINRTIDEAEAKVQDIFARYELVEKRTPSVSELKKAINKAFGRNVKPKAEPAHDIFAAIDLFMKTRGAQNSWSKCTYQRFRTMKDRLHKFDAYLTFNDIDDNTLQQYVRFLGRYGLHNTTMAKNISNLRWFLRWASEKGYYKGNAHETFRPKLKGSDGHLKEVIYLTTDELQRVQDYKFPEKESYLEHVRDVFLFCCFSGLRYSDVKKLKKSDIHDGCIYVVTQKTIDDLRIELNDHTRAILDKYKDFDDGENSALPVISNQKMNDYLKRIGRKCGIDAPVRTVYFTGSVRHEQVQPKWQLLSTHAGRRTFVVTALLLGVSSEVIMKWTGHSDFEAMRPYVKIVDELKKRSMDLFNKI